MADRTVVTQPHPLLSVADNGYTRWNTPEHRRAGFRSIRDIGRYGITLRAPRVRLLPKDIIHTLGDVPAVQRMTGSTMFCALVVLQDGAIAYEKYAADFAPHQLHTIMSITKTTMTLAVGKLVEQGKIDLAQPVGAYLPEVGSGYASATVQQVLDMNVVNDYIEDYSDPACSAFDSEVTFGWRLPADGGREQTIREYLCTIQSDDVTNYSGEMLYKSANTDILGWIVERQSGRSLRDWYREIAEAAGIEHSMYVSTDREFVPLASGGISLSARDLARYGALFLTGGVGVNGEQVGSAAFLDATRANPGTHRPDGYRYSNQTVTNGRWLAHGGYGGQWMMADPDTQVVVAFFSVMENRSASDAQYGTDRITLAEDIVAHLR
ncbi:MAG: serine hydrolase [Chloroflexi bacterium]|nr:MAG: serine hydrolase [Chloroflexota bacterium]